MNIAAVEYLFLFDPTKTWAKLYQFETELKNLLDAKGMEGIILDTMGRGGKKIVYIRPKAAIDQSVAQSQPKGRPLSIKSKFAKMKTGKQSAKARDFKKGKLLKRKGYLRRG